MSPFSWLTRVRATVYKSFLLKGGFSLALHVGSYKHRPTVLVPWLIN